MITYQSCPVLPDVPGNMLSTFGESTPLTIEQIDILLRLVSAARENVDSVLCVGGDLGVLAGALLDEHPRATACVVDGSDAVLAGASDQLQSHRGRFHLCKGSPEKPERMPEISGAPFDAICLGSDFALSGRRQRELFCEFYKQLEPGGILLMVRHVASATRWTESRLDDYLIDAIFGEELRLGGKKTRAEIAREHFRRVLAVRRETPAPLEVQCDWLEEIGFESVACYSKVGELAVYGGQRPR